MRSLSSPRVQTLVWGLKYAIFLSVLTGAIGMFPVRLVIAEEGIDINTASKEELQEITGVGPVIAQRIIDARPFSSVHDLIKVGGIGEVTLEKIIEQGLARVVERPQYFIPQQPELQQTGPKIVLTYPQNNPANKEIEVFFSVSNLKDAAYDVKISIEKESVLSDIYNEIQDKWQSSHYYIKNLFSGSSFEGTFNLKIREEGLNFQGEADILARVRENGKSNYLEHREKIDITAPEPRETEIATARDLAAIGQQASGLSASFRVFSIASALAIFSGIIILILKNKLKQSYNKNI